jgi:tetratricopeptide (TPR) repeat protein
MPRRPSTTKRFGPSHDGHFVRDWITRQIGGIERRRITFLVCRPADPSAPNSLTPYKELRRILEKKGGSVLDRPRELVACWGYPNAREDDPLRAVQAACELCSLTGAQIATIVDSALVSAPTATDARIEFDDLISRAVRELGEVGSPGFVFATDAVRAMTDRHFTFASIGTIFERRVWRLIGTEKAAELTRKPRNPLIGRTNEVRAIDEAWELVMGGRPACISICGEAGIGKSQLLRHLEQRARAAGALLLAVACRPEARHTPLHPLRQAFRLLEDFSEDQPFRKTATCHDRQIIRAFIAGNCSPHQSRLQDLLLEEIRYRASGAPVLLAFEDLHWADQYTIDFVTQVGTRIHLLGPICLAWTSRHSAPFGFKTHARRTQLWLQRLSAPDIVRMLKLSIAGKSLAPALLRQIAKRSEGIPLFAQELARLCVEAVDAPDELQPLLAPGPLNLVLSARLDSLGHLKPLAQAASVLGREFDVGTLAAVLRIDGIKLLVDLNELSRQGILELDQAGKVPRFRFTHALLRDAAYASIIENRRKTLHGRVADVLTRDPAFAAQAPEVIAGHYEAAGDGRGAFVWWYKAGLRAAEHSSARAAVTHLKRALKARQQDRSAGTAQDEIEIHRLLGISVAALKGNGSAEAIALFERCLDLSRRHGVEADFDALWALHSCYLVRGEMERALPIGDQLTATADHSGIDERRLRAHRMQGLAKLLAGRLEEALVHYRLVLELYDERLHAALRFRHASDQGALAYAHMAWAEAIAGHTENSARHALAALRLSSRLQHPHTSAHVLCILAARAHALGERGAASALAFAGKALGVRHEFPYWSAWADIILGWAHADRAGLSPIQGAIEAYKNTGAIQALPFAFLLLAEAALASDQPRISLIAATEGWNVANRQGLMLYAPELLRVQAIAELRLGSETSIILDLIKRAAQLAAQQGAKTFFVRCAEFRLHPYATPATAPAQVSTPGY